MTLRSIFTLTTLVTEDDTLKICIARSIPKPHPQHEVDKSRTTAEVMRERAEKAETEVGTLQMKAGVGEALKKETTQLRAQLNTAEAHALSLANDIDEKKLMLARAEKQFALVQKYALVGKNYRCYIIHIFFERITKTETFSLS